MAREGRSCGSDASQVGALPQPYGASQMSDLANSRVLMVLTSVSQFPDSDRLTGYYMDEMAIPYWAMRDSAATIEFASIKGGEAPADPGSLGEAGDREANVQRFLDDDAAMTALKTSRAIAEVDAASYDGIFLPGGHGTMWDFAQSADLAKVVGTIFDAGAVVGAVCHGPAGLVSAKRADGQPIVADRRVNAFTDQEERAVELDTVVPYLLETELRKNGALFESNPEPFGVYAVRDGNLVTGQNPASAPKVAKLMVEALSLQQVDKAA